MKFEAAHAPPDMPKGGPADDLPENSLEPQEEVDAMQSLRDYFTRQEELSGGAEKNPSPDAEIYLYRWARFEAKFDLHEAGHPEGFKAEPSEQSIKENEVIVQNYAYVLAEQRLIRWRDDYIFTLTDDGKRLVVPKKNLG